MEPFFFYYYTPNKTVLKKYIFEMRLQKNNFDIYIENFFYLFRFHLNANLVILVEIGSD